MRIFLVSFVLLVSTVLSFDVAAQSKSKGSDKKGVTTFKAVTFPSEDGLEITAELYAPHADKATPFIVLCHQARWSRGEYREIAPKLNQLGFNCVAIDQRSGDGVNNITNETTKKAKAANKPTGFVDAEQDMIAALKWAKANQANP